MYGRHFELEDELVSHISRRSIDILKANYRVSYISEATYCIVLSHIISFISDFLSA